MPLYCEYLRILLEKKNNKTLKKQINKNKNSIKLDVSWCFLFLFFSYSFVDDCCRLKRIVPLFWGRNDWSLVSEGFCVLSKCISVITCEIITGKGNKNHSQMSDRMKRWGSLWQVFWPLLKTSSCECVWVCVLETIFNMWSNNELLTLTRVLITNLIGLTWMQTVVGWEGT